MIARTNEQNHTVIYEGDRPYFVVVPYADYKKLTTDNDDDTLIPNDVIQLLVKHQCNLLGAWRRYRKMTQGDFADKMGITQSAVSQIEKSGNPHSETIDSAAKVLDCQPEQLTD